MKILITGATGFLGSHLAELLVKEGHSVRALVRRTSKTAFLEGLGVDLKVASLERGDGLTEALEGVDAVVHSAGLVKARSEKEFHEVNVTGTANLLDATLRSETPVKRFVYVSSLTAHGFSDDGAPRDPSAEPNPLTLYGRSKLAAEGVVLAAAERLPVSILRPPAIYGPRDTEMYKFFQMIARRVKAFMGSPQNRLSLVYAPDCARAIRDMIEKDHPSGSAYFVEDGRQYTQAEFAGIVEEALGVKALPLKLPIPLVSIAAAGSELYGRVTNQAVMLTRDKLNELKHPYLICSSDDIRRELGWAPEVQLEEGARRTVAWYKAEGWL